MTRAILAASAALIATLILTAARERALTRAAGDADPTPDDIGAAEARDYMRSLDPDGAW